MNTIIIFGAGKKGRALLKKLDKKLVLNFADNDENKVGTYVENIPIISFNHMLSLYNRNHIDIILSVDSEDMRNQLMKNKVYYWNNEYPSQNYFFRPEIADSIDSHLLEKFLWDEELKKAVSLCECSNWYREEFCSNENKYLVELMKEDKVSLLNTYLKSIYSENKFYSDEYYKNRPGMRLIKNILDTEKIFPGIVHVCDLACGHGELLSELKKEGFIVCGVDSNYELVQYIRKQGVQCIQASVDSTPFDNNTFEVVICQECLEHVYNPDMVVKEIKRILTRGGIVFCTVPYGKYCDDPTHVRHFYIDKFYSLFKKNDFDIINIIKIPYLNCSNNNNLFLAASKNK